MTTTSLRPAGHFGTWLSEMRAVLKGERHADVPCDGCVGCCVSSYAIPLRPADKVALDAGTWTISEESSTGAKIGGVPIEEAIFFLLTTWVSAQGVILLSDERSPTVMKALARKARTRLLRRPHQARKGL